MYYRCSICGESSPSGRNPEEAAQYAVQSGEFTASGWLCSGCWLSWLPKYRLYIFDKDGTLLEYRNRPPNTTQQQILLPRRRPVIEVLRRRGARIAIASNQGGVAWGFISPTEAAALLEDCAAKIGGADAIRFCPHDARAAGKPNAREEYAFACGCRKPAPGMLLSILEELRVPPHQAVYVGDSPEDEAAARAAGIDFISADAFFLPAAV